MRNRIACVGWWLVLLCAATGIAVLADSEVGRADSEARKAAEEAARLGTASVLVEFFYEPGCKTCERVNAEVLPELEARLGNAIRLERRDVTEQPQYERLLAYQEALDCRTNASSVVVVERSVCLAGWKSIRQDLIPTAETMLARRLSGDGPPRSAEAPPAGASIDPQAVARERIREFSAVGVAVAGLVDGINPCAMATMVFMVSLLTTLRIRGWHLLAVGGAFCLATFLTYFAIGFSLLGALNSLSGFDAFRTVLEVGMVGVLLILAALSVRDALRYRKTGRSDQVLLKLPAAASRRVHRVLHGEFRRQNLIVGGFLAGALVTAVESVCTGQVYVPTLVYLIKIRHATGAAWGYLVLYNMFFLIPLLLAFAAAWFGVETSSLIRLSRENVVTAKLLLAGLFVLLAAAILLL